jgi:hypothetical protein
MADTAYGLNHFYFMKKLRLLLIFGLCLPLVALGQVDNRIFQFSGLVISRTSDEAVPFAQVQVNHTRQGILSNPDGFYSVPVALGDTLYFSHIGYHQSKLVVKDYLVEYEGDRSQYIYAITYLLEDTVELDTVNIFPYDTPEELRTAVVNMDVTRSLQQRYAEENLDPKTLHAIMQTLPVDGGERIMVARQMYYDYYQTKNLLPTVNFDPIAATRLLQAIVERTKRKKNKDLNYWEN